MSSKRTTDTALNPLFLERWSPRAYDGSIVLPADLLTILDAGRWAPSSYNIQPWRFLYATPADAEIWDGFLELLIPFNRSWAKDSGALIFILSDTQMGSPEKPNYSHSFDAGAAWMAIALQAHMLGYHAHAMVGIEIDKAREALEVPTQFKIDAAVALGRLGNPETLAEGLRDRERPSDRRPLGDLAYPGPFRS